MYYTIHVCDTNTEEDFCHGVYLSFEDGMRFKDDIMDEVIPVSDEKARKLILAELYDIWCDEDEFYGDMEEGWAVFDDDVARYIEQKLPGWELLLDYDNKKDNIPYMSALESYERHRKYMKQFGFPYYPYNFNPNE